jgi:cold shock CspA family protein
MYIKDASTLNEGQNVSFNIVPRLRTRHRSGLNKHWK